MRNLFRLQKTIQQLLLKQLLAFVRSEKLSITKFVCVFFKSSWYRKQLSLSIVRLIFSWLTYSPSPCFLIAISP